MRQGGLFRVQRHHRKAKKATEKCLKKYCLVSDIVFREVSKKALQSALKAMQKEIELELGRGSKMFFDITERRGAT